MKHYSTHFQPLLAEFIGTFLLVLFGTGAIVVNDVTNGGITHLGISLMFGVVITVAILLFGKVSGAHINPAATLMFLVRKEIGFKLSFLYIITQLFGAVVASYLLSQLFPEHLKLGATLPSHSIGLTFGLELLLTFILMLGILLIVETFKHQALNPVAFVAGAIVFMEALFAGPITGASMNPARSFGPALVSGHLEGLWIYIVAPLLGAVLAYLVNKLFYE